MDDTIGKRIQRVRIERSHTQVELAYRIRETLDTINKIESEKIEPDQYIIQKIQKYFKIKL
jgi:ribosome-binding protein aMBF1 (putative translation factor)|tara:strand:+ start:120 stop:302 length:183 start_codon:yes stop_codon:yes gene_type:complete